MIRKTTITEKSNVVDTDNKNDDTVSSKKQSSSNNNTNNSSSSWIVSLLYEQLAINPIYDVVFILGLVVLEAILGYIIIIKVSYTEIDWIAYMEEVTMWYDDGETNYMNIRGGTGPLVYPAGFVYLFTLLRYITNNGTNIRIAQYIFYIFYLLTQITVFYIYQQTITYYRTTTYQRSTNSNKQLVHQMWMWRIALVVLCLSKRIHSIYILRLFNDGPTMLLFYISLVLFNINQWDIGCIVFSLAVSIKMNILLYAPGLLLLLLQTSPNIYIVVRRLLVNCALPQIVLGLPFLTTYPISYLRKAFELDRVFFYKWTVNFKFLNEDIFISKRLSLLLLLCHIGFLLYYFIYKWPQSILRINQQSNRKDDSKPTTVLFQNQNLTAPYITTTMFVSNFVGICFARTLHYQFYSWYFHTIPYLLWISIIIPTTTTDGNNTSNGKYPIIIRLLLLGMIETAFLTFPATSFSSIILQIAHLAILYQIQPFVPAIITKDDGSNDDNNNNSNKPKIS